MGLGGATVHHFIWNYSMWVLPWELQRTVQITVKEPRYIEVKYIQFVVEACGSSLSTARSLFWLFFSPWEAKPIHYKFAAGCFSLGIIKLTDLTLKELYLDKRCECYCGVITCPFYSMLHLRLNELTTSLREWHVKKLKSLLCDFLLHCGRKALGQSPFPYTRRNNNNDNNIINLRF